VQGLSLWEPKRAIVGKHLFNHPGLSWVSKCRGKGAVKHFNQLLKFPLPYCSSSPSGHSWFQSLVVYILCWFTGLIQDLFKMLSAFSQLFLHIGQHFSNFIFDRNTWMSWFARKFIDSCTLYLLSQAIPIFSRTECLTSLLNSLFYCPANKGVIVSLPQQPAHDPSYSDKSAVARASSVQ
jgi:hypothetical protein